MDGKTFKTVAKIPAGGINNSGQQYRYTDMGKLGNPVFYRLKMTDKSNLGIQYSNTISLGNNWETRLQVVSPNPFSEMLYINIHLTSPGRLYVSVSDLAGRKVKRSQYNATAGLNTFSLHGLGAFVPGTYLLEINSGVKLLARKLVIKK